MRDRVALAAFAAVVMTASAWPWQWFDWLGWHFY
jgi:hypothetical protein